MGKHRLDNVQVCITCELGRKELSLKEIRQLKEQDVIELDKLAGEAFDIRINGREFASGEAVVVTDMMAVRVTSLARTVAREVGS
jgi:flagellar motor switch protein FliN/FliY